jgi:uncharacterized membrane protein
MTHAPGPGYAILIAAPFPLALGALLADNRYATTFEVQWINFADWLVAGSLVFGGLALAWTLLSFLVHRRWRERTGLIALGALTLFWVLQFVNALVHAKDAYASMPAGLVLSVITTILSLVAAWTALAAPRTVKEDVR